MGPEVRHHRASLPGGWAAKGTRATAQARGRLLLKTSSEIRRLLTALLQLVGTYVSVHQACPLILGPRLKWNLIGNKSCISTALNMVEQGKKLTFFKVRNKQETTLMHYRL